MLVNDKFDDCNYGNGNNTRKWRNNDFFFFFTMLDLVKLFSFSGSGFLHDIFFTRYTVTKFYNTFYS